MKVLAVALLVLVAAGPPPNSAGVPANAGGTPPGAINPNVTQENIHQTICVPGWTKTIRPTVTYTNRLKHDMLSRGYVGHGWMEEDMKDYELDHYIPLELGGHPTDPNNLWPQPWIGKCGAHVKDTMENLLHRRVCAGETTLADAQTAIRMGCWGK